MGAPYIYDISHLRVKIPGFCPTCVIIRILKFNCFNCVLYLRQEREREREREEWMGERGEGAGGGGKSGQDDARRN